MFFFSLTNIKPQIYFTSSLVTISYYISFPHAPFSFTPMPMKLCHPSKKRNPIASNVCIAVNPVRSAKCKRIVMASYIRLALMPYPTMTSIALTVLEPNTGKSKECSLETDKPKLFQYAFATYMKLFSISIYYNHLFYYFTGF